MTTAALPVFPIVDTHCHLDYLARETEVEDNDPASVMARAKQVGIEFIVNPSVSPDKFAEVIKIAESMPNVYAAVAIHPTDVSDTLAHPDWIAQIESLLSHPKVVAIGETGLDYYWSSEHIDLQKQCLREFLRMGVQYDKPVILHDRTSQDGVLNSHEDLLAEVSQFPQAHGIMHCFSGDAEFAQRMIDQDFMISFAGNLTYKNAHNLHDAAKVIPLDKILVETDTPFLSPVPFRGKPNEPARVQYVVAKIAELKELPYEEVARVTTENARRVFGIL